MKEFAGTSKKGSHVWRVRPLFSGEEGTFFPGHDLAGVSIRGMVIIFDALEASNDLGAKVPDTAEARLSLYFINITYGRPDVFCTVFHHDCYSHGIHEFRSLGTLSLTAIYRRCVFGHFNLYFITAVYRSSVFAFHSRDPCPNRDLQERCFSFSYC